MTLAVGVSVGGEAAHDPDRPVRSEPGGSQSSSIVQGIAGRLVTASGHPVAGARITAQSLDPTGGPIPEIAILSDAEGRFAWPLRPGRYRLAALIDGREVAAATAIVEPHRVSTLELSATP
jgi:hypothetical protein